MAMMQVFVSMAMLATAHARYTEMTHHSVGTHYWDGTDHGSDVKAAERKCDERSDCAGFVVLKIGGVGYFKEGAHIYGNAQDVVYLKDTSCGVNAVSGKWQPQFSIAAPTTVTFKHGTKKTNDETKKVGWSNDVTSHVQAGLNIYGFGVTKSAGSTVGHQMARQSSQEWTMNSEEDFAVAFQQSAVGKYVWQFAFSVDDTCHSGANPTSKEYALTSGLWEEPCCYPGYCVDAPFCNTCHSAEFMLPDAEKPRCSVGALVV